MGETIPDAPAVTQLGSTWTYEELGSAIVSAVTALEEAGVRRGEVVAVIGPRGFTLAAAWTAVLAHQAVLLPIDTQLPSQRQQSVLAHAHHILVVGNAEVPPTGTPTIRFEHFFTKRPRAVDPRLLRPPSSDEPGYVFMTSGTTGKAKAIIGRHRSLAHFVHWQRTTFGIGPGDRVAHTASAEFDVSLREVFTPLTSGATLCLPPPGVLTPSRALLWLADEHVTVLGIVPTVARAWLRSAPHSICLPDLRAVFFNGEVLLTSLTDRWRQQLAYRKLIVNLYGPTETTLARSWHIVTDAGVAGIQPLGRPVDDSTLWIQTPDGRIADESAVGEIVIRTPYASGGYLNATAEENARFSVDPAHPADTVYFTGDLGQLDADGVLHFHGRSDDQIKIYGTRIHLRGVEAVLEQQAGIEQAVVVADVDPAGGPPRLRAHLILSAGRSDVPAGLRADLRHLLPTAAIPSVFVIATDLPTIPTSGKVDRRQLAAAPTPNRKGPLMSETAPTPPSAHELSTIANGMRAWVLAANKHPGGTSSAVEVMTALYFSGATRLNTADGEEEDRLIYSKGHAAAPWYFALWASGCIPGMTWMDLAGFGQVDHPIPRMPRRGAVPGMQMSTGALGQGLSFGVGTALADARAGRVSRTFVVLGDGECTEGQVWEAAMTAARLDLHNLVALIDANGSGSVIPLAREEWAARWAGFGWNVEEVDGHDVGAIAALLDPARPALRPTVIILKTVKGKGLLPPAEGSNTLSGEVDPSVLPDQDTPSMIAAALSIVDRYHPWAADQRAGLSPRPAARVALVQVTRDALEERIQGYPVGSAPVAKKALGGDLSTELAGLPLLWMAPDAIRNSGLLERMNQVGSWDWAHSDADVLQCAIAEQDAASLAAGAASAGLLPVLFSMEGFYWRMLDQIRESIAFSGLPVLLVGTSGGLGDLLGPMVQSDGALAAIAAIPGLDIYEAGDINTAKALAIQALAAGRPAYLRLPHEAVPVRHDLSDLTRRSLETGVWQLQDSHDPEVVIVAAGAMREAALGAATLLEAKDGRRVTVLEVVSLSRFTALSLQAQEHILSPSALIVSIHNAPSTVLGAVLPREAINLGADGFGIAGFPLANLYETAGLTAAALYERIAKELA